VQAIEHRTGHVVFLAARNCKAIALLALFALAAGSVGIGLLTPHLGGHLVYIAIGGLAALIALADTYRGLFIILLMQPLFFSGAQGPGITIAKAAYALIFLAWFGGWIARRAVRINKEPWWHPMIRPAIVLALTLLMACFLGLFLFSGRIDFVVRDLSQYLGYLAVLPIADVVRGRQRARQLLLFLAILGLPGAVLSMLHWAGSKQGWEWASDLPYLRFMANYWTPFEGLVWAAALIPVRYSGLKRRIRIIAGLWIGLRLLWLILSGFRGSIITELVILGVVVWAIGRIQPGCRGAGLRLLPIFLWALIVGWVVLGVSGIVELPGGDRNINIYGTLLSPDSFFSDLSVQGRLAEAHAALSAWRQSPIVGVGLGYNLQFVWWDKRTIWEQQFNFHVGYTETLMKFGVVGALIFFWYFWAGARLAWHSMTSAPSLWARALAMGVLLMIVGALVGSVSGSSFSDRGFTLTLGVMLGVMPAVCGYPKLAGVLDQTGTAMKSCANAFSTRLDDRL